MIDCQVQKKIHLNFILPFFFVIIRGNILHIPVIKSHKNRPHIFEENKVNLCGGGGGSLELFC